MTLEKPLAYVWVLASLALLVGQPANAAEERVHRFHADIEVGQDGMKRMVSKNLYCSRITISR